MLCYELFHILGLLCLGQARNWPIVTFKWQSKGKIKVIVIVKQMRLVSKKDVQNERHGIKWLKLFKKIHVMKHKLLSAFLCQKYKK